MARRRPGKRIDRYMVAQNRRDYAVELRMVGSSPTEFVAYCDELGISVRSHDVDEARKLIDKEIESMSTVDWRLMIRIKVKLPDSDELLDLTEARRGSALSLSHEIYAVGTRHDGEHLHRLICRSDIENGDWKDTLARVKARKGLPDAGYLDHWDDKVGRERAVHRAVLVDYTDENYAACIAFHQAIRGLAAQVEQRFSPKNLEETLRRGREFTRFLLPEPKEAK